MNTNTLTLPSVLALQPFTPVTTPSRPPELEPAEYWPERPRGFTASSPETTGTKKSNKYNHILAGVAVVITGLALGSYYERSVAPFESTDDAYIEGDVTPIAPRVAGQVVQLFVQDNQAVKAGDVLLQIDPNDYQAKLDQATANLTAAKSQRDQASAQLTVDQAKVGQEKANVVAMVAEAKRAAADYKRFQAVGNLGVSDSQLDLAGTQASASAAQVQVAQNKELAAEALLGLDQANIQTATAQVQRSEAGVRQAELDLSYTRIVAPEAGFVTHRGVEPGAYVQPGQALLALVPHQTWVIANFKETQLSHMRPGQPVEVRVDAYPQIKFQGHVDSIQAGSGTRFSLLPPENASGNFVKIAQRVPVKILLDDTSTEFVLAPGMSAVPAVRVQ